MDGPLSSTEVAVGGEEPKAELFGVSGHRGGLCSSRADNEL